MALTVGTNSYTTLGEAQSYLFESFRSPEWNIQEPSTSPTDPGYSIQEIALIAATRLVDRMPLRGHKASTSQALAFPRDYHALTGVPQEVKEAQTETAYFLIFNYWNRLTQPQQTLDLSNFMEGAWDVPNGSRIKLEVKDLSLETEGGQKKQKLILTADQPRSLTLPTKLPEAALILLKEHLSLGVALER